MARCLMFKHAMTIGPTGGTRPCCAFDTRDVETVTLDQDWQTRHEAWYQQSLEGWVMPGCRQCHDQENLYNQRSMRQRYNREFQNAQGIKHWDLKINNTCNLACRMCDATSSSTWQRIVADNPESGLAEHYKFSPKNKWWRDSVGLVDQMYDASYVKFTGGEPFLIPQVRKIVQSLIDRDIAPAVTLQFTTNGTQDMSSWMAMFAKFQRVELIVSVDAVGDRYEYIRQGASWEQVNTNIAKLVDKKLDNMDIAIHCLPQALNTGYTHLVEEWADSMGVECEVVSALYEPDFMTPQAATDPVLRRKLIEQLEVMDRLHGTDWRDFLDAD